MKFKALNIFAIIALLAAPLMAQQKPKPVPPPTATTAPQQQDPGQLSFTEKIAVQALTQQEAEKIHEVQDIRQQEYTLVRDIEAHHPGYHYDAATGVLEKQESPHPEAKLPSPQKH